MPVRRIALLPSIALLLVSTGCVQLLGTFERDPGGAGGTGGGGAGGAGGAAGAGGSAGAAGAGGAKQASGPCGYGCDGLDADCDGDAGNGFEADLRTDPANCGGCGVACATGTCSDGACTVLTVWTGAEQPRELKLDETLVYFLLDGSVIGMTKDGVAQSSYAIAESAPQSLAQDGDHLYWVSKGSSEIRKVAKTGGMVSTVLTEPFVDRVAVDGPTLFWTTTGDPGAPVPYADGAVRSAALDGSGQAPVASGQQHPLGLAAGDGNLLWSTGDPVDPCLGQVNLLSPGAQSPEVFASLYASSLELAAGTVVSVDACTNQFTAQPLAGGPAGAQGGLPYAIEGSVLYGVFYGAGLASPVWALPSAQTVVDVVDTATTAGVVELGVDQTSLFYSSQDELGNHVIRRVEKPWSLRPHGSCPYGRADCNDDPWTGAR